MVNWVVVRLQPTPAREIYMLAQVGWRISALVGACLAVMTVMFTAFIESANAQRSRGYYVILGSFPDRGSAMRRSNSGCLQESGHRIKVIDSNYVDGFRAGL